MLNALHFSRRSRGFASLVRRAVKNALPAIPRTSSTGYSPFAFLLDSPTSITSMMQQKGQQSCSLSGATSGMICDGAHLRSNSTFSVLFGDAGPFLPSRTRGQRVHLVSAEPASEGEDRAISIRSTIASARVLASWHKGGRNSTCLVCRRVGVKTDDQKKLARPI
jgi:hypothetical protein